MGSPIRKSADITDICSSPQLIAACHVLRRLLMPRHSPCALSSLTASSQASYRSPPRTREVSLAPLLLLFLANPFHWASLGEKREFRLASTVLRDCLVLLELCRQFNGRIKNEIVTLHLSVLSTIKTFLTLLPFTLSGFGNKFGYPNLRFGTSLMLPCLSLSSLCSVFKVQPLAFETRMKYSIS